VELGCVVSVEEGVEDGPVFRAVVSQGTLVVEYFHLRRTKYLVRNKAPRPQVLYVEHPRTGWELMKDAPEPAETTDGFWRFRRELAATAQDELVVSERTRGQRQYLISNVGLDEVTYFVSSRYIDRQMGDALREVVALRERVAALTQDEQRLTAERDQVFKDQERIRSNIESLKSGASQRELAERFVAKLNEQEDRLEAIGAELERLMKERQAAQEELNRRIQALRYTAEL